jgi:hypothetical protein
MSVFMLREDFDAIALSRKSPKLPVREVALDDLWMVFATYDGTAKAFFDEQETARPHAFAVTVDPESENEIFTNVGKQAEYCREHGEVETARLLATAGLKLGQVRAPAKVDPLANVKGVSNPYDNAWKGTEEARQKAIVALLASKDPDALRRVASLAKAGGRSISGQKLQPVGAARFAKK